MVEKDLSLTPRYLHIAEKCNRRDVRLADTGSSFPPTETTGGTIGSGRTSRLDYIRDDWGGPN